MRDRLWRASSTAIGVGLLGGTCRQGCFEAGAPIGLQQLHRLPRRIRSRILGLADACLLPGHADTRSVQQASVRASWTA